MVQWWWYSGTMVQQPTRTVSNSASISDSLTSITTRDTGLNTPITPYSTLDGFMLITGPSPMHCTLTFMGGSLLPSMTKEMFPVKCPVVRGVAVRGSVRS